MSKERRKIRTGLAEASCKMTRNLMHLTGRGGTALPGKIALFFDKNILQEAGRDVHVVVVTGTNGKTTTCRMLGEAVTEEKHECLQNRSGANLLSGITAEFVNNLDSRGRPKAEYAVIECDEGALKQVVPLLQPEVIVVTNLFRDQLDRYGEVMNTREQIRKGLSLSPNSVICLNADCPLTATVAEGLPNRIRYYGISTPAGSQEPRELSDAKYCIRCGEVLSYRYYTYAHLGGYYCPSCGFSRPEPDTAVTQIKDRKTEGSEIRIKMRDREYEAHVRLPAVYNIYNGLAAFTAGDAFGLGSEALKNALGDTSACFGRMETFDLGEKGLQMILVKNPAGCNQAISYITGAGEEYNVCFCLNDRTADGHDISWIWDADFEKVMQDPNRRKVFVSGNRAEDMQLRLKYAGAREEDILLEKDYGRLIRMLQTSRRRVFVLPNYTSMLEFRKTLLKTTGGDAFWKG